MTALPGRVDAELRPDPTSLAPIDVAFEFSRAEGVIENVGYALQTGCRAIVLGTTGWSNERPRLAALVEAHGATLVDAPTYSIGAVLFGELAESAARIFGRFEDYDPYVLEWHRRAKADRPSGTAAAIANRLLPHLPGKTRARLAEGSGAPELDTLEIVSLRAGASPGMHLVGFDAPGESIELRITARDRSAYVAGALLAADWLRSKGPHPVGLYAFDAIVRSMLGEPSTNGRSNAGAPAASPPTSAHAAPQRIGRTRARPTTAGSRKEDPDGRQH